MTDRAYELFRAALEADDRDAFLASCGELRADVEAYLELAEGVDDGFLAQPAGERLTIATFGEGDKVGRFTIGKLVGSGGAGAVYEALQDEPRRTVALKVMRLGFLPERFREEAEILARLDHPDIAHVYEAGVHEGTPYIAMEYVVGARTLGEHVASLDERARLRLFARICDAVHHGHVKGVVHRDLKPANILVRETGPKIIDFGIARVEGIDTGDIAGTLAYMSPEQCAGTDVDARSDVYSLGAVLHELVRGAPPHAIDSTTSIPDAIRTIRETPPPDLGGDLGAIVAKALAKDRDDRYASASALADDVRRYLRAEPVSARPASWFHQFILFARRRTAVLVTLLALFAAVVAGSVVSLRFAFQAEAARRDALQQAYQASIVAAGAALQVHNLAGARAQLEQAPEDLRGWEWRYLFHQLDLSTRTLYWKNELIYAGSVAPRAGRFAATSHTGVRVWDVDGEPLLTVPRENRLGLARCCALSPDGTRIAAGFSSGFAVYAVDGGRILHVLRPDTDIPTVWSIAFSPDGERVVAGTIRGAILLWAGGEDRKLAQLPARVMSLAFTPDGSHLFAGDEQGVIRILDPATGRTLREAKVHENNVESVAPGPRGRLLASCSMDGTVRLLDAGTLAPRAMLAESRHGFKTVAFAPDGATCAAGGMDRRIRVWRVADGAEVTVMHGHRSQVRALGYFGPDRLFSMGRSDAIKFWDTRRARTQEFAGLDTDVRNITPLEDKIAAVGQGGRVCVWDSRSGKLLLTRAEEGVCAVIDEHTYVHAQAPVPYAVDRAPVAHRRLADGRELRRLYRFDAQEQDYYRLVGVSPGSGLVVLSTHYDSLFVHRLGRESPPVQWHVPALQLVTLSADGRFIATWGGHSVHVWLPDGTLQATFPSEKTAYGALAFRGDGAVLATGSVDGTITLRDPGTGRVEARLTGHGASVLGLAFSPDGDRLASASADGTVRLWDPDRAAELLVLEGHAHYAARVQWSADGETLYSGGAGIEPAHRTIRAWRSSDR